MVCRRVQVLFPRVLTSGGHSEGGEVDICWEEEEEEEEEEVLDFVMAAQSAKEVHERHLF